jgi:hypothetical protein
MPSNLAGRIVVVLGVAAILLFVVMTFVPSTAQVLVAVLSLPVVAMLVAATGPAPRRRLR